MDLILTALYIAAVVFAILAVFHNPNLTEYAKYVWASLICLAACVVLAILASMGAAQDEAKKRKSVPTSNRGPM